MNSRAWVTIAMHVSNLALLPTPCSRGRRWVCTARKALKGKRNNEFRMHLLQRPRPPRERQVDAVDVESKKWACRAFAFNQNYGSMMTFLMSSGNRSDRSAQ
jgi:hypothetical protein